MDNLERKVNRICRRLRVPAPIEFLTQIMGGYDPRGQSEIYEALLAIDEEFNGDPPSPEAWLELRDLIRYKYQPRPVGLTDSKDAAIRIAEYLHAKKKNVEHVESTAKSGEVEELTGREIRRFSRWFNNEY